MHLVFTPLILFLFLFYLAGRRIREKAHLILCFRTSVFESEEFSKPSERQFCLANKLKSNIPRTSKLRFILCSSWEHESSYTPIYCNLFMFDETYSCMLIDQFKEHLQLEFMIWLRLICDQKSLMLFETLLDGF